MVSAKSMSVAERAKAIYHDRLQTELESKHRHRYVAVEPESGDHFLADSFAGAVASARTAHPDQICFVIRIGHSAALHLGGMES